MSDGSRRRARIIGTSAARLALNIQSVETGTEFFETDTSNTYKAIVAAGAGLPGVLTLTWLLLGNSASVGGSWASFAGAGPHTITSAMGSVLVTPGAGVDAVMNLPSLLSFADDTDLAVVMLGGGVGASVVLVPAGGQTLANVAASRFYEGGAVILRANRAALAWEVVSLETGLPNGLDIYVATTGSDSNPGTSASPLLTLGEASRRQGLSSYVNYCHINMAAGTYVLAAGATISLAAGSGGNTERPAIVGTTADSGLGSRTVAGSTAGSGSTFATITDGAGGLVVNAWSGYFLRYTSGAQVGKEYVITSNTANVFTVAGTQSVPINGDTFEVVAPSTTIQSTSGSFNFLSSGATDIGVRHVLFNGQSIASSALTVRSAGLHHSACWFLNFDTVATTDTARFITLSNFASLGIPQTVGSNFTSNVAGARLSSDRNSYIDLSRSLFNNVSCVIRTTSFQTSSVEFRGATGVRGFLGSFIQIVSSAFETVNGGTGDYGSAAIIIESGSTGTISGVVVNNCTNRALVISSGVAVNVVNLTGAGNALVPVLILRGSSLVRSSGNTVTGAVAGQDVQIGGNAASTAWAAVNAGLVTDQAAAASQFCIASN